tara:strand:- start:16846 stop:17667 length:822 start_codon:yes stop_codon:yes gene_type:complete
MRVKNGVGYFTFAINTDVDYEKCAVLWALSLRATQKHKIKIAVVVNNKNTCRKDLHDVFDFVISKPKRPVINPMQYEADLLQLSPFKETIKMECDMLVPCDLSVWMHTFRLKDLTITGHVINHKHELATDQKYRQFVQTNKLPNVYNGLYYVRYTAENIKFYRELDRIFVDWKNEIKKYRLWERHAPSTDFAMSMALANLNMETCVVHTPLPTFIHNKKHCVGDWKHYTITNANTIIVNGTKLQYPWHYHDKNLASENLIFKYKQYVQNLLHT